MSKLKMHTLLLAIALGTTALLSGCTDAGRAQLSAYGETFQVTLYAANGSVIKTWTSDGKVQAEEQSDGWYFMDAKTHMLVRVSGTVVVEQVKS